MEEPVSLRNTLASEDWQSIASILLSLNTGVNGSRDTRKLKKKIGIVRQILYGFLANNPGRVNLSFLVGSIKTVEALEKEFDAYGVKEREFLIFLRLLIYKLEKQKIMVNKPMEKRFELRKLKGVTEHGSLLRETS